jgi:hypothetical protein
MTVKNQSASGRRRRQKKMNQWWIENANWYKEFFDSPSIGSCVTKPVTPIDVTLKEKEKEEMNTTTDYTRERSALQSALYDANHQHMADARKEFHIDCINPKTPEELYNLMVGKHFEPIEENTWKKIDTWCGPLSSFRFRKEPKDEAGFNARTEKISNEFAKSMLRVSVLPPTEGLKAVEAYRDGITIH